MSIGSSDSGCDEPILGACCTASMRSVCLCWCDVLAGINAGDSQETGVLHRKRTWERVERSRGVAVLRRYQEREGEKKGIFMCKVGVLNPST